MVLPRHQDRYKKLTFDPRTGGFNRQWLRYGDGVYEPVRRDGNLRDKWSDPHRLMTWWVEEKPDSWVPEDDGMQTSMNHDYGEENKPKTPGRGRMTTGGIMPRNPSMEKTGNKPTGKQRSGPIREGLGTLYDTMEDTITDPVQDMYRDFTGNNEFRKSLDEAMQAGIVPKAVGDVVTKLPKALQRIEDYVRR